MSGHFFVPEIVAGGFGKEILVFGLIHLLIVDQFLGIPVLTLPYPEYRKMLRIRNIWECLLVFYSIEMSIATISIPYLFKSFLCMTNRNVIEIKKKIFTGLKLNPDPGIFLLSLLGRENGG